MIGSKLAHYEITAKLGEGGMGEVYRATDSRLKREVAIKVLPAALAEDPDRLARLEREAQVLAALNHPNIAAIYGLEEASAGGADGAAIGPGEDAADGAEEAGAGAQPGAGAETTRFLVMELVEGRNLAERLSESRLDIDESLKIALQIAEALEAAHERGIVHRDLKPANIQIATEGAAAGQAKVLDFGLAKAFEADGTSQEISPDLSASPTMAAVATRTGMIIGTAGFMSPEQARGKPLDKRADVWAFGCVLYEMLTGRRAFGGETVTDILAAIVHQEPRWDALPPETPLRVRELMERCLQKQPDQRLRDIGEARIAIEHYLADPEGEKKRGLASAAAATAGMRIGPLQAAVGVVVLAVVAIVGAWMGMTMAPNPTAGAVRRFALTTDELSASGDTMPKISPDGTMVVYPSDGQLWLRELDQLAGRPLPSTENATFPFWSPDSDEIAFEAEGTLWRLPIGGGTRAAITEVPELEDGYWGPDDRIFIGFEEGIAEVSARGGDPQLIIPVDRDNEIDLHHPVLLPDGRSIVFRAHGTSDHIGLWDGTARRRLVSFVAQQSVHNLAYSPTGHLIYTRAGGANDGVWAHPFSADALEVTGDPFLLAGSASGASVSGDGVLVYVDGAIDGGNTFQLRWANRDGTAGAAIGQPQFMTRPRLSPDEQRVAVTGISESATNVWVHDTRGNMSRITQGNVQEAGPAWDASETRIAFVRGQQAEPQIFVTNADGSGEPEELADGWDPGFSADGRYVAYVTSVDFDIMVLDLGADGAEPAPFLETPSVREEGPEISPDGRLIAYVSNESGEREIHVRPFPAGQGREVVSLNGGRHPRWSGDASELFFATAAGIMSARLESVDPPRFSAPEVVVSTPLPDFGAFGPAFGFDVAADGRRFVVVARGSGPTEDSGPTSRLILVENWFAEKEMR